MIQKAGDLPQRVGAAHRRHADAGAAAADDGIGCRDESLVKDIQFPAAGVAERDRIRLNQSRTASSDGDAAPPASRLAVDRVVGVEASAPREIDMGYPCRADDNRVGHIDERTEPLNEQLS